MTASPDWIASFPALQGLDADAVRRLASGARIVNLAAGTVLFQDGDSAAAYLLVLDGAVRVQKVSENGREIVLYRVDRGQSCVLTTSCLLTDDCYAAEGVVETDVKAVAIGRPTFQDLLARSAPFRSFVFATYSRRIADLLMLIEEVAFGRIDVRLAQMLLARADGGVVAATHQELAVELGTAREVVSRQLKEFERRGWIAMARGRVELKDTAALAQLNGDRS